MLMFDTIGKAVGTAARKGTLFLVAALLLAPPTFAAVAADNREIVLDLEPQKIITLN